MKSAQHSTHDYAANITHNSKNSTTTDMVGVRVRVGRVIAVLLIRVAAHLYFGKA